jgi:hypothetical protein
MRAMLNELIARKEKIILAKRSVCQISNSLEDIILLSIEGGLFINLFSLLLPEPYFF